MAEATENVVQIDAQLVVKAELVDVLEAAANKRRRSPASIMGEVIEAVLTDGLIDAILDDQETGS